MNNQLLLKINELDNWTIEQDVLKKIFVFETFMKAIHFINEVAVLAEHVDHHPDLIIKYNQVNVLLTTHDAGNITNKDYDLAKMIDDLKI
jgi:4a-hydroxytetrahydrobiopterin dehydratase